MDTNGIYVLGKVTKPGKLRVEFEFIYKGILHLNEDKKVSSSQYMGEVFFVKVLPYDTNSAFLILDKQVPRCIKQAPFEGWKQIPKDTCSN